MIISFEIFSAWLVVFLTLSIFTYLYDDNPFYKAAEHLYIGISAGYIVVTSFWQQVQPNMLGRLWPKLDHSHEFFIDHTIRILQNLGFTVVKNGEDSIKDMIRMLEHLGYIIVKKGQQTLFAD